MKTYLLALVALLSFVTVSQADDFSPKCVRQPVRATVRATAGKAVDALDVLNRQRAARGLRPYLRDPALTIGAMAVAKYRAEHRIYGHCRSDFAFLPDGTRASAAGCAANPPGFGFMACCRFENWRYCGAAHVMGADGRLYCHLFVR